MSRQPSSIPAIDRPARSRRPALAGGIPPRIFAICLTSILVAVHYTNYGPLTPTLMRELHISSGQTGLFSTFLFAGLAVMYIPAGTLADRFGQRPVLLGSSILFVLGSFLLPLLSSLSWA
jgi:MFS family permease